MGMRGLADETKRGEQRSHPSAQGVMDSSSTAMLGEWPRRRSRSPFPSADHWWAWLEEHHAEVPAGVWLTLAKGGAREPTSLTYDGGAPGGARLRLDRRGQARRRDESSCYCQRWTPRRARSIWSKRNVGYAERLDRGGPDASPRG